MMQLVFRWGISAILASLLVFTAIAVIDPSILGRFYLRSGDVYEFDGVAGPTHDTIVADPRPTSWTEFSDGGPSRLAILLTDPDSAWLGLAHGLKSVGVPFIITDDPQRAIRHRVIMAYPRISGRVIAADSLRALGAHVRSGGTLLGVNVLGGGLQEVFGFDEVRATREHRVVRFDPAHVLSTDLATPEELEIRIAATSAPEKTIGAHEYLGTRNPAVATYANGAAALTWRAYSGGYAYALGFDPGLLLQKAHGYRLEGIAPAYVNTFEPSADVILRLIRDIYRRGEPRAVTMHTVPWNKSLSVNVTHDVDYNKSLANSVEYARMERSLGVTATYFIQTKYIRDWNDEIFFNDRNIAHLKTLSGLGMEIASHSVSHSKVFSRFPLGTGDERYPDYVPYVYEERSTYNGTVLGELRVSKFLLDQFSDSAPVVSFRAGYLENPFSLPQVLQATGYAYDSTMTANNALSHLPYRLNYGRSGDTEVEAWEFAVTIEDERSPPLPQRLDQAVATAHKIAHYGGNFVLLIHPNALGEKMKFQRELIIALKPIAWFGSIAEFGEWWRARDFVEIDSELEQGVLRVNVRSPMTISGLTLIAPAGFELEFPQDDIIASVKDERIVLQEFEQQIELVFRRAR
ncbi:MAG: hypothetical protein ACN4GT_01320 [Gammaproteobacteria bacterium]